jgi:sugar lactone lactonase YvrE
VAVHSSSTVRRYTPDGVLDRLIGLPVSMVTSCAFGGPDLGDLYITTMQYGMSAEVKRDQPLAGALFHCRPGVRGNAPNRFGAASAALSGSRVDS